MSYSIEFNDNNCYEGTTCLINKFNIKKQSELYGIETELTLAKAFILETELIPKT